MAGGEGVKEGRGGFTGFTPGGVEPHDDEGRGFVDDVGFVGSDVGEFEDRGMALGGGGFFLFGARRRRRRWFGSYYSGGGGGGGRCGGRFRSSSSSSEGAAEDVGEEPPFYPCPFVLFAADLTVSFVSVFIVLFAFVVLVVRRRHQRRIDDGRSYQERSFVVVCLYGVSRGEGGDEVGG